MTPPSPERSNDPRQNATYWRAVYEDQLRRKRLLHERHDRLAHAAAKVVDAWDKQDAESGPDPAAAIEGLRGELRST